MSSCASLWYHLRASGFSLWYDDDMESNQPLVITDGTLDISNQLTQVTSSLTDAFAPLIILSVVITGVFLLLHIISMFRRRKIENALLDMHKLLHEMNERDKARSIPRAATDRPAVRSETIAAAPDQQ